jgi:hypothetical protein
MSDELLVQYRELQDALARFGVTPYTRNLSLELKMRVCRELDIADPFTELEPALDQLHLKAFPDPGGRPPRLVGDVMPDPRV